MSRIVVAFVSVACVVCVGAVLADPAPAASPSAHLTVTTDTGPPAGPLVHAQASLRCGPRPTATGFLRASARRACRSVASGAVATVAAAARRHRVCTQVYGGPQRATIAGRVGGRTVKLTVTRTDGCGIADWDRLRPLLGDPERTAAPPATPST